MDRESFARQVAAVQGSLYRVAASDLRGARPFFFCSQPHTLVRVIVMNIAFCAMLLAGVAYAAATGRAAQAQQALLSGGAQAVELCVGLAGAYAFFGGVLGVMRAVGLADALARVLRRPLIRLLRFAPGEEAAAGDVSVNLAANMLGMGSAATPAGIRAMQTMARAARPGREGTASDAMIAFLVVNTTSVQLLPATMIALRAQAGAANPADIVPATLAATVISTLCGVLACRLFARFWK